MTNRFMISVAAIALIAGTGFANAQGTGTSHEAARRPVPPRSRARHRPIGSGGASSANAIRSRA